jgi:hypothetical protein
VRTIPEPARSTPVVAEADVIVAGGGPAGILAALASGRAGARTLLIERYGVLGGTATAGRVTSFNGFRNEHPPDHVQTVRGYVQELIDRLLARGAACGCTGHGNFGDLTPGECPYAVSFDPEALQLVALEMLEEAGVRIMLHTWLADAPSDGRNVSAAIVESKSGRQAITGRIYVDATGDGDLAAAAGARFEQADTSDERLMAVTLMYRVAGLPKPAPDERRLWINGITTRWGRYEHGVSATDAADLTRAEIRTRRDLDDRMAALKRDHPDARLIDSAAAIGVREARRVVGLYTITEDDCLSGRPQLDSVAVSSNPVPSYYGKRLFFDHLGFAIPYRSLVPADLDNVVLAGRCISACQPAFQSARSMAPAMAISQASGTAAALCAASGCRPADLDVPTLQERLEGEGAVVRVPPDAG